MAATPLLPPPPAPPTADSAEHADSAEQEASASSAPTDQQAAIEDLFGGSRTGHEIEAAFEQDYAGRRVEWTGEVENSRSYRSDHDFGDVPGTKTTVRLGSIGSSRLMSNRIKAVVDLLVDTDLAREDEIQFSGTLLRVDRFTRTLFVRDADLHPCNDETPGRWVHRAWGFTGWR
ncbi:MAG: hypothetical protein P8J50_12865 [Acidimicrobiales bacterium]|nr:hypothetical protein [Acidimicrobiales bacterium]